MSPQEADRNEQYENLRERIKKMQRAYEDNAGAEDEKRMKQEEEIRERYVREEEKRLTELDAKKRSDRAEAIANTTKYLFGQIDEQERLRKQQRAEDEAYARRAHTVPARTTACVHASSLLAVHCCVLQVCARGQGGF